MSLKKNSLLLVAAFCILWGGSHAATIPIILEHAVTREEIAWGLMQRDRLPSNQGMLFHFSSQQKMSIWSFNCKIDLSLAILDDKGVILEIRDLNSHYEWMDPDRPVNTLEDMAKYPPDDPIIRAFTRSRVVSRVRGWYVLEMPKGWFKENHIEVGDQVTWVEKSNQGSIQKR